MKAAFPLKIIAVLPFVLATLFAGCGGVGGNAAFSAKCELACRPDAEATPCNLNGSPQQCKQDCEVVTAGLSTLCAQCLVDHISAYTAGGDGTFRSDGGSTPSTPACYAYSIPSVTSYCKEYCLSSDGGR